MQRMWVMGFLIALAILILVGIVWSPLGALLGGLVLFSAAAFAIAGTSFVRVRERTALIVFSTLHDGVRRVVPGPATTFLQPFLEKVGVEMDTGIHQVRVHVEDVLHANQQTALLRFTAIVIHQLAPHTIAPARLGEILPNLTHNLNSIVQGWTEYYLRNLLANVDPERLHNGSRLRMERHLQRLLADHLGMFGIAVRRVQLVFWPPAGLHTTLATAEQQRVTISLQKEQLDALLAAFAERPDQAQNVVLLEMARSMGQNGQTWLTLDLGALMSKGEGESLPPDGAQLPLWPGMLYQTRRW